MIDPQELVTHLQANGVDFFTGVPDSLLKEFCACLEHGPRACQHIISANEGGAVRWRSGTISQHGKFRWSICRIPGWATSSILFCRWPTPKYIRFLSCL